MSIRARAWIALLLPAIAWFVFEQGLSALLHAQCDRAGFGFVWGAASLVACAVAARVAWPLRGRRDGSADAWIAWLALLVSGIFALAIGFQTLAIAIVPACVR